MALRHIRERTQSVLSGVTTQSMGTIKRPRAERGRLRRTTDLQLDPGRFQLGVFVERVQ